MKKYTLKQLIKPWLIQVESINLKIENGDGRKELLDVRDSCIAQIIAILTVKDDTLLIHP